MMNPSGIINNEGKIEGQFETNETLYAAQMNEIVLVINELKEFQNNALDALYPIGSIYTTSNESVNPGDIMSNLFNKATDWVRIKAGTTLVAAGEGFIEEGGYADITLPEHSHSIEAHSHSFTAPNHTHTVKHKTDGILSTFWASRELCSQQGGNVSVKKVCVKQDEGEGDRFFVPGIKRDTINTDILNYYGWNEGVSGTHGWTPSTDPDNLGSGTRGELLNNGVPGNTDEHSSMETSKSGETQTNTNYNYPPYIPVYMWRRVA